MLQELDGRRGQQLTGGTVRHHLNSLSNLFRRAAGEGHVPPGYNPVASLIEKPSAERRVAAWLEVPLAALLLEAARTVRLARAIWRSGGRRAEVLGLEVDDVSFDRNKGDVPDARTPAAQDSDVGSRGAALAAA